MSIEEMEGTIKSPAAASVHTLLLWQSWQVTRVVYVCAPPGNGGAVFYDFPFSAPRVATLLLLFFTVLTLLDT